jgi:hypothetical protein
MIPHARGLRSPAYRVLIESFSSRAFHLLAVASALARLASSSTNQRKCAASLLTK